MKARGGRFLMLLGAALAIMSFVVVYIFMSNRSLVGASPAAGTVPTAVPVKQVAIAARDLPAYTVLNAANVTLKDIDASAVMSDTTSEPSALYGKMATETMSKGQQIRTDQLAQSGFSNVLARGERAFALAVPQRSTFGGAIAENDRVDVLWSAGLKLDYKVYPDGTVKETTDVYTTTKTLLQDIKVLRVIELQNPPPISGRPGNNGADSNTANPEAEPASAVSRLNAAQTSAMYENGAPYQEVLILAVTDQQAEVLKFARENGGLLDLTLRSSAVMKSAAGEELKDKDNNPIVGDHENETTTGITVKTLIESYGLLPVPQTERGQK